MSLHCSTMRSTRQFSLEEIAQQLTRQLNAKNCTGLVSSVHRQCGASEVYMLTFECMYFRNNSSASLSILLTEDAEFQTADLVSSGGGTGIFKISLGANEDFVKTAAHILGDLGFTILNE